MNRLAIVFASIAVSSIAPRAFAFAGDIEPPPEAGTAEPAEVPVGARSELPSTDFKATSKSAVAAKAHKELGYRAAPAMKGIYGLQGRPAAVSWAAAAEGEESLQDDDLNTAWTCRPDSQHGCAIGFELPQASPVKVVRIWGAAGPKWNQYQATPRPALVRLHSDAGYVDVQLPDGAGFRYVVFAKPIETQRLVLEVLGTHGGTQGKEIAIAEFEVFGTSGDRRAPLDVDSESVGLFHERNPWIERSGNYVIRHVFLTEGEGDEQRRFARGTAMLGKKGDRLLLIEDWMAYACTPPEGGNLREYSVLDQKSRLVYSLPAQAEAPILRHPQGLGFAFPNGEKSWFAVIEGDDVRIASTNTATQLAELGFENAGEAKRSANHVDLPSGCAGNGTAPSE